MSFNLRSKFHVFTWLPLSLVFSLSMLAWPSSVQAVQEPEAPAPNGAVIELQEMDGEEMLDVEAGMFLGGFGTSPAAMKAAKKFQLTQLFTVEAEQIERVCKLDKKQALKLKIAVKGAIQKATDSWMKTNGEQFGAMGMMQAPGDFAEPDDGDEEKEASKEAEKEVVINDVDDIDETTLQLVTMDSMGNPFIAADPLEDKFWTKAVASVLSNEQSASYKDYISNRRKAKLESIIVSILGTANFELGLSEEQMPKFEAIVRKPMQEAKINSSAFFESYMIYYHASKADNEELKKVLSPAQLQKWRLLVAPAKQVGQMMEMDMEMEDSSEESMDSDGEVNDGEEG